jgi:hypothetical protein
MTKYNTADVVAAFNEFLDLTQNGGAEPARAHLPIRLQMLGFMADRFPLLTEDGLARAFEVWRYESAEEQKEINSQLEAAEQACRMFDGAPGARTYGEACQIKAEQGDEFAKAQLAAWDDPASRPFMPLFFAAVEKHPGWETDGRAYWPSEDDAPQTPEALVDWFQMNHPRDAKRIEAEAA